MGTTTTITISSYSPIDIWSTCTKSNTRTIIMASSKYRYDMNIGHYVPLFEGEALQADGT